MTTRAIVSVMRGGFRGRQYARYKIAPVNRRCYSAPVLPASLLECRVVPTLIDLPSAPAACTACRALNRSSRLIQYAPKPVRGQHFLADGDFPAGHADTVVPPRVPSRAQIRRAVSWTMPLRPL